MGWIPPFLPESRSSLKAPGILDPFHNITGVISDRGHYGHTKQFFTGNLEAFFTLGEKVHTAPNLSLVLPKFFEVYLKQWRFPSCLNKNNNSNSNNK